MKIQLVLAGSPVQAVPTQADVREAIDAESADAARVVFDFNKHTLAQAMRSLRLTAVVVTYSGCGDSGQIDEVGFQPSDVDEGLRRVIVATTQQRWDHNLALGCSELSFCERLLRDAAESLCDEAISLMSHDGYENSDGGSGTFTLQAADGAAELDHSDYYTECDTSTHAL